MCLLYFDGWWQQYVHRGQSSDQSIIMGALVAQAMNPLFLEPTRFLVAVGPTGEVLGM